MVPSTTQLHYDIFTSIIDELALCGQFEDLSACSQTCRMLLHPCRVHLFSTVTIGENAPQFAALLDQNPTLQVYIRELTYEPTILSEDIANALLLLNTLKTLVLQTPPYYGDDINSTCQWGSLTPHVQHALAYLFSSPSVTCIQVRSFSNVPAILLSSCSNLEYLDIFQASFSEIYNSTVLAPPKLVSFDVAKALRPTVGSLLNERRAGGPFLVDLSGLRSLSTDMMLSGSAEEMHLAQILHSTPKLVHLCLAVVWNALIPDSLVQALTFSLPTLRSLEWNINSNEVPEKFPGLINVLQALAHHPNNIYEFNLILMTSLSHALPDQDWEKIDQILADPTAFPGLGKLSIKFWTGLEVPDEEEENKIRDKLTEFRVTKLLRLSKLASDDYLDFQVTLDDDEPYL